MTKSNQSSTNKPRTKVLRSSAFFLAFGYIALAIATLVLFAAPLWYAWRVTINEGRTELLNVDAQRLTAVYRSLGAQGLADAIHDRVKMQIAGERILLFADASHRPIAGNISAWPKNIPNASGAYTISMPLSGHMTQVKIVRASLPNGYSLLVGRDLSRFAPLETRFWIGLAAAVSILCVIGALGGIMLRRALMSRIQGIDQTVSAIMRGDFSYRLITRSSGDELDTLSMTINHMLDQIEQLIHGIRNVSNAIAHDLRTPLAELRFRLEDLVLTQPSPHDTFIEIDNAIADVDRVIRIFNALLRLAEIDSGIRHSGFVQADVANIVAEAVDFYLPATELKGISLSFYSPEPISVYCDPILLTQAIGNLIDNALKYVNTNGKINVNISQDHNGVRIVVADNGPGIPDAEKKKVVERFFRGFSAIDTQGIGLGLTLVDAVAQLHGGRLELADNYPGLRAMIVIAPAKKTNW